MVEVHDPTPPVNVRAEMFDGRLIPLDMVYGGWDVGEQKHVWVNATRLAERPKYVYCDMLPPDTVIEVKARRD